MAQGTMTVKVDGERHTVAKVEGNLYCGAQCDGCGQSDGLMVCRFEPGEWGLYCPECQSEYIGEYTGL